MGIWDRIRSDATQLAGQARLLRHLHKFQPWAHESAARHLLHNAQTIGTSLALAYGDVRESWSEFNERANQWGHFFLNRGIVPGDVVALMMDNCPAYLHALMGLNKIGAVCACINTHGTGRSLVHAIQIAKAKMVVVGSEHAAAVDEVAGSLETLDAVEPICVYQSGDAEGHPRTVNLEVEQASVSELCGRYRPRGDDVMALLYTSGTTGLPKAATIKNGRFLMAAYGFGHVMHEAVPRDVIYNALPLYHGTAQWGGWGGALTTGAALALRRRFSASEFWNDVRRYEATHFMYIGEVCRYLMNQPPKEEDRSHRVRIAVGNGLRKDIWVPFQQRFGIPLIREFYGATEGNAPMANLEGRPGMIGRLGIGQVLVKCDLETGAPIRGERGFMAKIERAGQTGLLLGKITPLARFDGYADAEATEKKIFRDVFKKGDAYFNSGDLLTLEEDGWVSFADRVGDTFRWKGENVSTHEVAEILNGARGVREANVYGVEVPGSEGRAGMVSLNVDDDFDIQELARFVIDKLPNYKRPYFVRVQKDMQITGTFKHQKVDYRRAGYDPSQVRDPLYFLDGERYVPIDEALYADIRSSKIAPR